MKYIIAIVLLVFNFNLISQASLVSEKEVLKLMGTRFEISAVAIDELTVKKSIEKGIKEIKRIEALISSWVPNSQTSAINANAGIQAVKVDPELFHLIERSIKISKITEGAFDISFAAIEKLYQFDKNEHELPSDSLLHSSIINVDWESIILNKANLSIYLPKPGMRIGFGGIGKGYAANQAKKVMAGVEGVLGGVVNAAGDLMIWGENGKESGWPIQISDPKNLEQTLGWLNVFEGSVVTSGDYEKYFTNEGDRYAHIINPNTGLPTTGIKSATIVCPDAEVGDALATAVFILGVNKSISLINSLKNIEVLIITDDDNIVTSNNLILKKV